MSGEADKSGVPDNGIQVCVRVRGCWGAPKITCVNASSECLHYLFLACMPVGVSRPELL